MTDDRPPLLERVTALRSAMDRIDETIEVHRRQGAARARWWAERHPPPPPARTVAERLAGLSPRRTRIGSKDRRGRVLRATEPIDAGEVVLAEPALVRIGPRAEDDPTPEPWRMVAAIATLDEDDHALVLDLHDAHEERRETYEDLARRLLDRGRRIGPDPGRAAALLGIVRTNAFGRGGGGIRSLYPAIAMVGHRCDPSCDRHVDRGMLLLQTRRDLAVGEEVTISYVDATLPAAARLALLLAGFGFTCDCPRCAAALVRGEIDREQVRLHAERLEDEFRASASDLSPAD